MDFNTLASPESITKTVAALESNGFKPRVFSTSKEALDAIKQAIPQGASVTNGASRTLEEIGLIGYLKAGAHGWNNLHAAIVAEKDPAKQALLRERALTAQYYLGSVHALTEGGEMIIASASGSQLPHLAYSSPNLILVVGAQKIVPTVETGLERISDYVFPLEDKRMKETLGMGSMLSKELILRKEPAFMGRSVHVFLVNEKLGF